MIRQVLLNILTNAVKFTEIGSVNLKVIHPDLEFLKYQGINVPVNYTDKSYLMFSVTDTGIGIAEENLNNIFSEYRQFDRSASKKYGGTGLGLAISKKILEHLGGIIWVESEQTQGSTFSFIIPIERPKAQEEVVSVE
ncbi:MAG: ATP-binding protein [Desulfobacterales bacterium]|nr:ATP-binding protein [Desulfobacterales bacterium]